MKQLKSQIKKSKKAEKAAGKKKKVKGKASRKKEKPVAVFGCLKGMITMSPDFDDPLEFK